MAASLNEEQRQHMMELQKRMNDVATNLNAVTHSARRATAEGRRATLVLQELGSIPADAVLYTGVGRAYLRSDRGAVAAQHEETKTKAEAEMKALLGARERLLADKAACEADARELMAGAR